MLTQIAACEELFHTASGTPLLPHGKARLGAVARKLGESNRTLPRRLTAE
jgi:hypothetical protein